MKTAKMNSLRSMGNGISHLNRKQRKVLSAKKAEASGFFSVVSRCARCGGSGYLRSDEMECAEQDYNKCDRCNGSGNSY